MMTMIVNQRRRDQRNMTNSRKNVTNNNKKIMTLVAPSQSQDAVICFCPAALLILQRISFRSMLPDPVPVVVADRETSDSASDSVPVQDSALGSSIEMSREGSPAFEEIRHPDESSPGDSPPAPSLNMSTSSTSGDNNSGPVAAAAAIQSQEDEEEVNKLMFHC